jgi:ABC-type transport system involved in multi-copper enzyme maturation permease subunit
VLLGTKRVAPYAMLALFAANAVLWWGWGPALSYGLATNGDFVVVRNFTGFSFMTLPLFTAVLMGDPVARDFRAGITPLLFSKPMGRGAYLAGKFFGNFFVLVCCQSAFALTALLLQGFRRPGMVVQPARVGPYFKHFLAVVVITHLALAAFYFAIGTLTRNAKIVYALAAAFYPLYIAYQSILLRGLPTRWRVRLDPLLMNWADAPAKARGGDWLDAEIINRLAYNYGPEVLANRAVVLLLAAGILALLYLRFSTTERAAKHSDDKSPTTIGLGADDEGLFKGETSVEKSETTVETFIGSEQFVVRSEPAFDRTRRVPEGEGTRKGERTAKGEGAVKKKAVALPEVQALTRGARAGMKQLGAAVSVELRLLFAERSLLVLLPLSTLASVAGLVYFEAAPAPSYSAAYAAQTADSFVLFMAAIAVFYTGEGFHRDRELRIEPVLWSMPAPNSALLLSKFVTNFLLTAAAATLVGVTAATLQLYKGHTPVEPSAYFKTYSLILMPGAAFMIAAAILLNVALRDKYLAYAACLALGGGLFYLYNLGLNHPLYNPLLYGLWTPADLTDATGRLPRLLTHRLYCLALAALCLSLAHLLFGRPSGKGPLVGGRISGRAWAALTALAAAAAAVAAGLLIVAGR